MNRSLLAVCAWSVALFLISNQLSPSASTNNGRQLENKTETFNNTTAYPKWLSSYIKWHKNARTNPDAQYLIVDEGIGGLGDRLKHIPYYMWLASKHSRVLLIHWRADCHIDEFFQTNVVNWTTPSQLLGQAVHLNKIADKVDYFKHLIDHSDMEAHKSEKVLQVFGNHLSLVKGMSQVVQESDNDRRVFRYIFQSLFRLADPVQKLLEETKNEIGLGDNYIGVHLRARYPGISKILSAAGKRVDATGITNVTMEVKQEILKLSNHAISCTRKAARDNGAQVYFASDTMLAMELQQKQDKRVVYLKTNQERIHFSHGNSQCNQYYPAIVDLWLLSEAQCVGFGVGGFGALATMMSNFDCWIFHQSNSVLSEHFAKKTNFFNDENGELPECLLPEIEAAQQ